MTQNARAGDVLQLQRRSINVEPTREYEEIGVRSFGKGIFHKEPVTGAELGSKRVFRIEPGDLVLSNVFAWEGAAAMATTREAGKIGSHRFMTFTPKDDRIDTAWAAWFFVSDLGLELIGKASPGSAGRNRTLAIERFENLEIPVPGIDEQRAAVRVLNSTRGVAIEVGENLRNRGADGAVESLPVLIDAVFDDVSRSSTSLSEVASLISDTVHPGDDPAPADRFIGLQHVERHTGRALGSDSLGPMKGRKFRFQPGDVLYGYLRPYLNKVWVADCHGLCSVDQYVLRPRAGVSPEWLGFSLRGRRVLDLAIDQTHSLQLPRLRSGLLADVSVPIVEPDAVEPTNARLRRITELVVMTRSHREHQLAVAAALLPSALNEVFGSLN